MQSFLDSSLFTWVILPVLIFCARIMDMSLDTIRIIMIGRGKKALAAFCGFFEVCIWLLVARQVIVHLPNALCFFAYAGGFAAGNYVGMWIEERLAVKYQLIRVMTQQGDDMVQALKGRGYGVTSIEARGAVGEVSIVYTLVTRTQAADVVSIIEARQPRAFYTIEDVRYVSEGAFPVPRSKSRLARIFRQAA